MRVALKTLAKRTHGAIRDMVFDDKNIDVAVFAGLAAGVRTEEENLPWTGRLSQQLCHPEEHKLVDHERQSLMLL